MLVLGSIGFDPWVRKIPWRRERLPTPVFWPGKSLGLLRVSHDWATFTFTLSFDFSVGSDSKVSVYNVGDLGLDLVWEDPLEKEIANYSSTLAWKIPWMEEHGRLQSMGSQRIGHDWATSLSVFQPFQDLLGSRMNCPKQNLRVWNHIPKVFCKLLNVFPTSVWFCVAVFYREVFSMPDEYGLW